MDFRTALVVALLALTAATLVCMSVLTLSKTTHTGDGSNTVSLDQLDLITTILQQANHSLHQAKLALQGVSPAPAPAPEDPLNSFDPPATGAYILGVAESRSDFAAADLRQAAAVAQVNDDEDLLVFFLSSESNTVSGSTVLTRDSALVNPWTAPESVHAASRYHTFENGRNIRRSHDKLHGSRRVQCERSIRRHNIGVQQDD